MLADVIRHYLAEATDLQSQPEDDQHQAKQSENVAAVTPVLPNSESVMPPQPAPGLAVTPVIPVTLQNSDKKQAQGPRPSQTSELSESDRRKRFIGHRGVLKRMRENPRHPALRLATGRRLIANSPWRYMGIRALCQLSIPASARATMQPIRLAVCGG